MGVHHAIIGRRMECLPATGMVGERMQSGTSHNTASREDWLIARYSRVIRFATSTRILDEENIGDHVCVITVDKRINEQRLCARIPIKWLYGIGDVTISF